MEYKIARANDLDVFEKTVQVYLNKGWSLASTLVYADGLYLQAVVK